MDFLNKLFKKQPKGKYVLSLDVGTRIAKAMVSYVDFEERNVTNLGIGKAQQKTGNVVGGKITDVQGVIYACREAIELAVQAAGIRPEEVLMGFSGNTIRVWTNTFELSRQNPGEKISQSELRTMISDLHEKSLHKIEESMTYREREAGIKLVSADVVNFSIDGYRIINPLNFRGRKVRITMANSYVSQPDFDIIVIIARELGLKLLKAAYGPYAVIKAIGVEDAQSFNAVMIDVGGNITDVVLVRNGNIQKAGMFILGGHLFTKRLANKFHIPEDSAEELKLNYSRGRLSEQDTRTVEDLFAGDAALWLSGVQLILEDAAKELMIPSRILFYGGGSQLPGIVSSLNQLSQTAIPFTDRLRLDHIQPGHISSNIDKTKKVDDFQDITLIGLAHLCLDTVDAEDTANLYLAQII
jgi:cell division protein FtsA